MDITLQRNGLTAIVDTKGAELKSLKDAEGTEYIWHGDSAYWPGRNPVLFPIVGNLKDGKVRCGDKEYEMNRHGFGRDLEFWELDTEPQEQAPDMGMMGMMGMDQDRDLEEEIMGGGSLMGGGLGGFMGGMMKPKKVVISDSATLQLHHSHETMMKYPYPFDFYVKHQLNDDGYTTTYLVENLGIDTMPFCIGAHTGFNCPLHEGESFSDYELVFSEEETCPTTLLNEKGLVSGEKKAFLEGTKVLPLSYEPFAQLDTLIFEGLKSKEVTLRHKETGHGVTMDFHQFPVLAFWTKGAQEAPFLCIEPWMGYAAVEGESGKFEDKPYVTVLQPGECMQMSFTVKLH